MAKNYPNRSDLRNPANRVSKMAARGQTYGKAEEQMRAQQAVPMASAPTDAVPTAPPVEMPGGLGDFTRMTERPDEPITAGMPFGEGPGPEVLPAPNTFAVGGRDDLIQRVRAAVAQYPNPNLIQLLVNLESQ